MNNDADALVERFPEEHVATLYAILPETARKWPYGSEALIQRLSDVASVRDNLKLVELRQRMSRS